MPLNVEEVSKVYGDKLVLDQVSLTVDEGEILGFVGRNGAGKSTTMRIIVGVTEPTAGTVTWNDVPLTRKQRQRFGYMPEERGLYSKMKVGEQVRYFAELYGLTPEEARIETEQLLERLEIPQYRDAAVEELSLGNQQRVQLAVALVHGPELLILDEPFSGLDPAGVDALGSLLLERSAAGVPIVFSSHQLDLLERFIDKVSMIDQGRIMAGGSIDQVVAQLDEQKQRGKLLRATVALPPGALDAGTSGWKVVSQQGDELLIDPGGCDAQEVLRALIEIGRVEEFGTQRRSLTEIYRELTHG